MPRPKSTGYAAEQIAGLRRNAMHRSRLAGFIIDCQTDDLEAAAEFWSKALGLSRRASKSPEDAGYALLETKPNDLHIEVQKVDHPSRVHLDIEADDVEARCAGWRRSAPSG